MDKDVEIYKFLRYLTHIFKTKKIFVLLIKDLPQPSKLIRPLKFVYSFYIAMSRIKYIDFKFLKR